MVPIPLAVIRHLRPSINSVAVKRSPNRVNDENEAPATKQPRADGIE